MKYVSEERSASSTASGVKAGFAEDIAMVRYPLPTTSAVLAVSDDEPG